MLTDNTVCIVQTRRRFGCRRAHDLLRAEHPSINHKRFYLRYREQGLSVRRRNRRCKLTGERTPRRAASQLNEVWSMDSVSDQLANGRRLKCLTVADDFSHEAVLIDVDSTHVRSVRDSLARPGSALSRLSAICSN